MRAILLIIDSFGIGAMDDASQFGDEGSNTALHICQEMSRTATVRWPTLQRLGLGNCSTILGCQLPGCEPVPLPEASFGVMQEASIGKDTTTGHWELAGIELVEPFTTFPLDYPSFPDALIKRFIDETGYSVLGNKGGSGIAIIEELGEAHFNGQGIILYTSADSVLQIAAHEQIVPLEKLYTICTITRKLADPYRIGRVIARPFAGEPGNFTRTADRKDFSMLPPQETILDILQQRGIKTIAIGKIGDIFAGQGVDTSYPDHGNEECLNRLITVLVNDNKDDQFLFVNLVDTDMLHGHRRDILGYHDAVAEIDKRLNQIIDLMQDDDILFISADHGCDPTFKGTDHTREHVPLLVFQKQHKALNLGVRHSFSDVAQSLASYFQVTGPTNGKTFYTNHTIHP